MDLNELTNIWKDSDKSLEKTVTVNRNLLKEVTASSLRSNLSEIKWSSIIEIIVNYFFLDLLTGFILHEQFTLKYFIPAAILWLTAALGIVLGIYKLVLYFRITFNSPVVKSQKLAERLKYIELKELNLLYVIIPVFSVAFLIVIAKGLANFDLYTEGNFLINYTIGSFIVGVIVIFFLKKFPDKKLQATIDFLKEIKETEK